MKEDTEVFTNRKIRLTADETLAMLEGAGVHLPKDDPISVRIDGAIDRDPSGAIRGRYATTISVRNAPAAHDLSAVRDAADRIAEYNRRTLLAGDDGSQPKAQ